MTTKEFKVTLEKMGFGIAHARRTPYGQEMRAYVAVRNPAHPLVDEVRYAPHLKPNFQLYQHTTKSNGVQYDRFVGELAPPARSYSVWIYGPGIGWRLEEDGYDDLQDASASLADIIGTRPEVTGGAVVPPGPFPMPMCPTCWRAPKPARKPRRKNIS